MGTIENIGFPYYYLLEESKTHGRPSAVFLGNDYKNMSKTLDRKAFIGLTNRCLDYMRRNCRDCALYYKPHPNETDEYTALDLEGFEVIPKEENEVAEVFFWKRLGSVRYAFSIASTAVWSAYNLGFNAYTFLKIAEPLLGKDIGSALDYYKELPDSFFIRDFDQPLVENRKTIQPDPIPEGKLLADMGERGDVWFIVGDPGMLVIYISFVQLIRKHFPDKRIRMILVLHHRWKRVKEAHYKSEFDSVTAFPRCLYSLRPRKFIEIIRTIYTIKNFKLGPRDVLLCFANSNLVENCFLSFFPNKKIAIQLKEYFEINYGLRESETLRGAKLRIRPTVRIFSSIIEPLLGLYSSVYKEYGDGRVNNIVRFVRPATEIYDRVYLLSEKRGINTVQ